MMKKNREQNEVRESLTGIKNKLVSFLKKGPFIDFEEHALERIITDFLLDDSDPKKRGWTSRAEASDCVLSVKRVTGVRLNVDYQHPENTESVKHLHQQFALVIEGKKSDGIGRVVLVIVSENTISIITVL